MNRHKCCRWMTIGKEDDVNTESRKRIYLNEGWKFNEKYSEEMTKTDFNELNMEEVRLPHTCREVPYHYFDEQIYQMVCVYRRKIEVPESWKGKCVVFTLEGVAHESEIFLNGEKVGEHHCGYTAFSIDLSKKLHYGKTNVLAVKVDSRESLNIPPFGFVIDYMTYGGIYRDVYIDVMSRTYLQDVFFASEIKRDMSDKSVKLISKIQIAGEVENLSLRQLIRRKGTENYRLLWEMQPDSGCREVEMKWEAGDVELWDIENPALYEVKTELTNQEEILDEVVTCFGFRKAEFLKDGFYLNDRKVKIRGLNRHQSYPYVGYAMPKSMQCLDADILKYELGVNAVRTSHYPQSHYFLERCDEIGLLVFTELPGWQHIGDEEWKRQAVENTRDMVRQYRNHASIILWGVRINESQDDDEFYKRTNAAAKELDPYRQTGGVRAHQKSSLLEDVYTYNDFSHDGEAKGCLPKKKITPDMERAYLVSEYNGHMYPAKAFDWEEHRAEQAIRHANVLDAIAGEEDISGSFGWCMTDYNTHKDFGSGDRICYHGVMDMFRNPKLAADIYACQQEERPVLSVSSTMDIGEHPGGSRGKIWIFTNADSVRMYKNKRFLKEYHREDSAYSHLLHGPILIDDFIGDAIIKEENYDKKLAKEITEALNLAALHGLSHLPKKVYLTALKMVLIHHMKPSEAVRLFTQYIGDWGGASTEYRFEGMKDGKMVKTVVRKPMKQMKLWAEADHTELTEKNSYDVAAVRIRMLDENGNLLNFFQEPVILKAEGPISLIGGKIISFKGGMTGTYLKTTGEEGRAALIINSGQAEEIRLDFTVKVL